MKKTLAALAVLGAFAGSALAAEVQLYGILDTGVGYSHIDMDNSGVGNSHLNPVTSGVDNVDSFEMKSGVGSGSRWGLKGTEELGNGLTVGFILEDGFDSDTGSEDSSNVMFNRESSLFLQGNFGKIALGRMGALNSGQSSWSKIGMINAFGTSYGDFTAQASNVFSLAGQWDNMIAYESPDFAGFKVFAQYGMGSNDHENESSSDRFYSLGVTYYNGPFAGYFAVDSINYKTAKFSENEWPRNGDDVDDSLTVTLGGSYDFEVVKIYLGAQYFDEVRLASIGGVLNQIYGDTTHDEDVSTPTNKLLKFKGYGISLTGDAPLAGGKAMFGIGYLDAEAADSMDRVLHPVDGVRQTSIDIKRYVVSLGYSYPFSKRTDVYGIASYMKEQTDTGFSDGITDGWDPSAYTAYVGLRHRF